MRIKKSIPNLITLGNLFCGVVAVLFAVKTDYEMTALFVVLGIVLDFFDGFAARILKVSSELGKQLDSLADMVTSGVVPGVILYQLISEKSILLGKLSISFNETEFLPFLGLIITLAAAYRLANFNIDERQSDSFIGLPTPAMSLFVIALPLIPIYSENQFFINLVENNYFLIAVTLMLSYLMNAEIPLFSLKFKSFGIQKNGLKYAFLLTSLLLLLVFQVIAIPLIIIWYVLLSVGSNLSKKTS